MNDFKNSFFNIATAIVGQNKGTEVGQLTLIDNFTMNSPILSGLPFEKASHDRHHAYSRLVNASSLETIDFDGVLPSMQTETQTETVPLHAFGGNFKFGEDRMLHSHSTPEVFLATQIPPVMRSTGMKFERSLYLHHFLKKTMEYSTARSSTQDADKDGHYETMVAITWEPGEMTGLYSPLPYGQGDSYGKLFETQWLNNKTRHVLDNGVIGYAATIKIFLGMLLANQ